MSAEGPGRALGGDGYDDGKRASPVVENEPSAPLLCNLHPSTLATNRDQQKEQWLGY